MGGMPKRKMPKVGKMPKHNMPKQAGMPKQKVQKPRKLPKPKKIGKSSSLVPYQKKSKTFVIYK